MRVKRRFIPIESRRNLLVGVNEILPERGKPLFPASLTSGDLLADRRFAYAAGVMAEGDALAAVDLLRQTLELVPEWVPAWVALAAAEDQLGHVEAAAAAYAQADKLDPDGLFGAGLHVARLRGEPGAAVAPTAYVAALFDEYAPRFDQHLVEGLGYSGPTLILESLEAACPGRKFAAALDLGCGTGLMGVAIGDRVTTLDGVDLSPAMLEQARRTCRYRALATGEIVRYLAALEAPTYELVLAADVFVYLGRLDPVLDAVARALTPSGLLAFTAQESRDADIRLGGELRFSHSAPYLRAALARAGLELLGLRSASTRRERGQDAPGLVVVARKP